MTIGALGSGALAEEGKQSVFGSPEEASKALMECAQGEDFKGLLDALGPAAEEILSSGDEVADKAARAQFVRACEEKLDLVEEVGGKVTIVIGSDGWPFPIPIVKTEDGWVFDTEAGKEEVLNRRIGRNELNAVQVCLAYVDAQREYGSVDWDANGVIEYAQQFLSDGDRRNGLYWEIEDGEQPSPLGPLVVAAVGEGYTPREPGEDPKPYHGYFYKIINAQGPSAAGGAYNYVINGHMVAGFGLLAWPAEYGNSGIMTFVVNQGGIVYERDLGANTKEIVEFITRYDPDESWRRAR
jgi:hypothetical protein